MPEIHKPNQKQYSIVKFVEKIYPVSFNNMELAKLETFARASYWTDRYFDDNKIGSRFDSIRECFEAGEIPATHAIHDHPELKESAGPFLEILKEFAPEKKTRFLDTLKSALDSSEAIHAAKDIPSYVKARREEAIHTADLISLFIDDKLDGLGIEKSDSLKAKARRYVTAINFLDTLADATKDWKNGEIHINPHLLRAYLLFGKYPGKPPYLSCLRKFAKQKVRKTLGMN